MNVKIFDECAEIPQNVIDDSEINYEKEKGGLEKHIKQKVAAFHKLFNKAPENNND